MIETALIACMLCRVPFQARRRQLLPEQYRISTAAENVASGAEVRASFVENGLASTTQFASLARAEEMRTRDQEKLGLAAGRSDDWFNSSAAILAAFTASHLRAHTMTSSPSALTTHLWSPL